MNSNLLTSEQLRSKIKQFDSDILSKVMYITFEYTNNVDCFTAGMKTICVWNSDTSSINASLSDDETYLYVHSDEKIFCMDASDMFMDMISLCHVAFNNFDTSICTNMANMFRSCTSLTSLDLRGFDTKNVKDFSGMFADCISCYSINLQSFTVPSEVESCRFNNMLMNTRSLRILSVGDKFKFDIAMSLSDPSTSVVKNSNGFWNCKSGCYSSNNLPSNVKQTYYATDVASDKNDSKLITLGSLKRTVNQIALFISNKYKA